MREMSRMLLNLERKANNLERKIYLNRSLSLNYKNHKNECCCRTNNYYNNLHNSNLGIRSRLSLTKDEKTDKNISKRRQLLDVNNVSPGGSVIQVTSSSGNGGNGKHRRHSSGKDRSIRRRHTVGGAHDYYSNKHTTMNDCDRYIVTDASTNTLKLGDD